jgi:hypothetical protein
MTPQTVTIAGQTLPIRELTVGEVQEWRAGIDAEKLVSRITGATIPPETPWSEIRTAAKAIQDLTFGTPDSEKN